MGLGAGFPSGSTSPVTTERPAPKSAALSPRLATATRGADVLVAGVEPWAAPELALEGILPGAVLRVAARTPLGGPVIVEVGRVRVAVAASLAAAVTVGAPAEMGDPAEADGATRADAVPVPAAEPDER